MAMRDVVAAVGQWRASPGACVRRPGAGPRPDGCP